MTASERNGRNLKIVKRIAAGLLCAAVACSFTACKDTTWSYKIDDVTITSGMYIAFQINAYIEAQEKAADQDKALLDQTIEDKTAEAWIADRVLEMSKSYVAVEKKFDELKLTLSDDDKKVLDNQLEQYWGYFQPYFEPNGAGKQSYKKILQNSYKSNMIFKKYYDEGGLEEVPEETLRKEFVDQVALVKYIKMPMLDAEGNKLKSEGKAELKKKAEKYVERLNKKENIDDLIKEYEDILDKQNASSNSSAGSSSSSSNVSSASSDSSVSASSDTGSAASSSGTTSSEEEEDPNEVLIYKEDESKPEKFLKGVFETAKIGVPVILEDDENYYVTIKYDISKDEEKFDSHRDSLLQNLKGDEFTEMVKGWYQDYKVETNEDSNKRYRVDKLKFPSSTGMS